ncbi:MAG: insulinase family protein [Syntrophobacterales bacterium]|nr:insulinase family protein [Syntrophobacterales bacterium]
MLLILAMATMGAFLLTAPAAAMDLNSRVEKFVLPNGLTILVLERHISPTVSLYIRYKVGAAYEQSGETGMAHFLEHMMFKGTTTIGAKHPEEEKRILSQIKTLGELIDRERQRSDKGQEEKITNWQARLDALQAEHRKLYIPNEMDRLYTENGAEHFNANTSQDMTTYLVSLPANKTELWARIESDRMTNTVFRDFYVERQVIREERRQRIEADPEGSLFEQFLAAAFVAHPYGRPVIGWPSDMENLSQEAMTAFLKKYYTPANAVIAVVGHVHTPDIIKQIQNYFGAIPSPAVTPPLLTQEPPQNGERRVTVAWDASPTLMIGYHKPNIPHRDDYVFDLIDAILSKGRTSRLHRLLVQEKGVAEKILTGSGLPGNRYPNLFVIMATPRAHHTHQELEGLIYEELERLAKEPVGEEELEKVKNILRADYLRGLTSNKRLAEQLSYFEAMVGDYRYMTTYLDTMETITAADIQRAARTYLTPANRTVGTITQKEK